MSLLLFPSSARYSACFGHVYPRGVITVLRSLVLKDNFLYTTNLGVRSFTVCCQDVNLSDQRGQVANQCLVRFEHKWAPDVVYLCCI